MILSGDQVTVGVEEDGDIYISVNGAEPTFMENHEAQLLRAALNTAVKHSRKFKEE